jgi:DNA invertase Pin-like site-specific DNA recombinase
MPTAVYCFRTRPKDDKKVRRWLADHPDEVMTFCDHDISRPQLRGLMAEIDAGGFDRLVVTELADLGMTAQCLTAFLADCRSRNVTLVSLRESFNLMTPNGQKLACFLAQVGHADREVRDDRQRDGINQARAAGRCWGGRPVGTRIRVSEAVEQRINELFAAGMPVAEIAKDDGVQVSLRTVYRVIAKRDGVQG